MPCRSEYGKEHYRRNKPSYLAKNVTGRVRQRQSNRDVAYEYLVMHPCVDCGEPDPVVLDFDHVDPKTKLWTIGKMLSRQASPLSSVRSRSASSAVPTATECGQRPNSVRTGSERIFLRTRADVVLRCSACHLDKPTKEFSFSDELRGTLNWYCRSCHAASRHAHYLVNKRDDVRRAVAQVRGRRETNRREVMRYLATHPCVDCGTANPVVLEFDHRDPGQKLMNVGNMMVSRRWPRVRAEIEKCDVRCANCHRRRTAVQFRWSKRRGR